MVAKNRSKVTLSIR